ncbi:7990_t:CDS:2 [Ambispora leptoticha]|uniref:7990_t:CDS:1 n=1 Tax=Ambispora leptoticha TaxID=144679 RepID=A0A9N9CLI3_9GLOM|nr:7990_t:CDS:2 [Ambispora leptoticha]
MISRFKKISSPSKLISSLLFFTIPLSLHVLLHPLSESSKLIHIKRSLSSTSQPPFIPASRYAHTATLVGKKLYFLGGITSPDGIFTNSSLPQAEFFSLDLSTTFDTTQNEQMPWENLMNPSVPAIAWGTAAAGGANNATIYLFGGVGSGDNTQDSLVYTFDTTIVSSNINNTHKKRELTLKRKERRKITPTPTSAKLLKKRDNTNSLTTVNQVWPFSLTMTTYECVFPTTSPLPPCGPGNGKPILGTSASAPASASTANSAPATGSASITDSVFLTSYPLPTSNSHNIKRLKLACAVDNQLRIYYLDGILPKNSTTSSATSGIPNNNNNTASTNDASNGFNGERIVSEFDVYDTLNNLWSTMTQMNGVYVPPMADYTATYVETFNSIIYIGGINETGEFNDMSKILVYSIDKNQFWFVPASNQGVSVPVAPRIGHSSVLAPNNQIIVYGGQTEKNQPATPELLILDVTAQTSFIWLQQAITNPRQASPFRHTATLVDRYMIVAFGRLTTSPDRANDKITLLDVESFSWVTSNQPDSPHSPVNVLTLTLLVAGVSLFFIVVGLCLFYKRRGYTFSSVENTENEVVSEMVQGSSSLNPVSEIEQESSSLNPASEIEIVQESKFINPVSEIEIIQESNFINSVPEIEIIQESNSINSVPEIEIVQEQNYINPEMIQHPEITSKSNTRRNFFHLPIKFSKKK